MEIEDAKQWVYRYFANEPNAIDAFTQIVRGSIDPEELYPVVDVLCGCADPLPKRLQNEYKGAKTYHDLWFEVMTDHIIENRDEPHEWMPDLYHVYIRDQAARGKASPSKAGFRAWLHQMIGDNEACDEAMEHWTSDMVQ